MARLKKLFASVKDGIRKARVQHAINECTRRHHVDSPFLDLGQADRPYHPHTDEDFMVVMFYKHCQLCNCDYTERRATFRGGLSAFLARGGVKSAAASGGQQDRGEG